MILTIKPKVQANALNTTVLIKSKNPKMSNRAAFRIIKPGIDTPGPTPVEFKWITGGTAGTISSDGHTYTCSQTNPSTGSEFWFTYNGQLSDLTVSPDTNFSIASAGTDNTFKVVYNTAMNGVAGSSTPRIKVTDGINYLNLDIPITIAVTNAVEVTARNLDVAPHGTEQADLYIFQGTEPSNEQALEVLRSDLQTIKRTYAEENTKTIEFPAYVNKKSDSRYGSILVDGLQGDGPYLIWMVTRKTGKEEQYLSKSFSSLPRIIEFETGDSEGTGESPVATSETADDSSAEENIVNEGINNIASENEEATDTVETDNGNTEENTVD